MEPVALLLTTAFHRSIRTSTAEDGYQAFAAQSRQPITADAFQDAIAACLRDGLIYDPVRLEAGALQCHWHLALTSSGVAAARALLATTPEP
jgi:hypothetical protein